MAHRSHRDRRAAVASSPPEGRAGKGIDRHWLHATVFTMVLVGLVVAAIGADVAIAVTALVVSAVGFGFFYLLFTGGGHFGVSVANALAVYACVFEFFRESNFPQVGQGLAMIGQALPVMAFLLGCILQRRRITPAIHARRLHGPVHLPSMWRWVPPIVLIGAMSFLVPRFGLHAEGQGLALLVSQGLIGVFVALAVRDVVMLLVDITMVFEDVASRLDAFVMPMAAFLTYYSLLVVIFTCLYRIAEITLGGGQFLIHGKPGTLGFAEALYFSVITIATVGYGDITPDSSLVRGLASIEVVMGLLLLLFGFSEIMRSRDRPRPPRGDAGSP